MPQYQHTREDGDQHQERVLIDGLLRNGVDDLAARRAHMREMTMARQAAERHYTHPAGPPPLVAARDSAADLRAELARIDATHRTWLHDHGVDVPARRTRRTRTIV